MNLEFALVFIDDDELVEITPLNIRLRKIQLQEMDRTRTNRKQRNMEETALPIYGR
jgi:GTP-binding protein